MLAVVFCCARKSNGCLDMVLCPCREWGSCPWLTELDGRPHKAVLLVGPSMPQKPAVVGLRHPLQT